jgi:ribose transport system substrate-binding protein
MKRKQTKAIALILAIVCALALGLSACSSGGGDASSAATSTATSAGSDAQSATSEGGASTDATYTIGYNNFGKGTYMIDVVEFEAQFFEDMMGNTMNVVNDEFKAEKVITDVQSMISSGADGIMFMGPVETTIPTATQMMNDAKVPFVMTDKMPSDDSVMETIMGLEYFAGAVAPVNYDAGKQIGETAAAAGNKTAIIVAAVVGDTTHDDRIAGFTEAFEAAGGEVLASARCADPTEGVTKAADLITANPDADCIYGAGGDYSNAIIQAMANFPDSEMKIYGSDIDPDLADLLAEGKIEALNGAHFAEGSIGAALLQNFLDGHPILDENGAPAVFTNLNYIMLPKDQVDIYKKYWIEGHPFTEDQLKSLLWRYNPEVSYQTFSDFCSGYSLESVIAAQEAAGN